MKLMKHGTNTLHDAFLYFFIVPQGCWSMLIWWHHAVSAVRMAGHYRHQPVPLTWVGWVGQVGWVAGLMLLMPNLDSAISMTQQELGFLGPGNVFPLLNCAVIVNACLSFLFNWQELNPVWSSAIIAHPWQVSTSCPEISFYTLLLCCIICLVMAHLLACMILAILLRPLSSTSCFRPQDCRWLDVVFVCRTLLGKHTVVSEQPRSSAISEIL
jgi:hypothetical protein